MDDDDTIAVLRQRIVESYMAGDLSTFAQATRELERTVDARRVAQGFVRIGPLVGEAKHTRGASRKTRHRTKDASKQMQGVDA